MSTLRGLASKLAVGRVKRLKCGNAKLAYGLALTSAAGDGQLDAPSKIDRDDDCPLWVKSTHARVSVVWRLNLQHRKDVPKIGTAASCHNRNSARYSITSSARARREGGMSRPSAFAVFRLMTNSNLVTCCTGKSAAFSPLRIRPT